ncbi:MAG: pantoate--beta-alanine ligase [Geodermatophilaceae bacterium]|nr:pantoate--beta-alanine ligase [Geodermatophilaceae bacterium]
MTTTQTPTPTSAAPRTAPADASKAPRDARAVPVVGTRAELADARRALPGRVVLVPTMGALHEGHRALMRAATAIGDHVVVSIFVNPTQFGPGEDLDRYPHTPWADLDMCAEEGVALVFMPECEQMYGPQLGIRVDGGALANRLEGVVRPGHFSGVLAVVAKLFGLVDPHVAVFGEKDYQQFVLIRAMSQELAMRVEVYGVPTVRESDGLALSSRNRYLDEGERVVAGALSRALRAGAAVGGRGGAALLATAHAVLDAQPGLELDYLAVTDPDLGPAPEAGPARLLVAARIGTTRLIDNLPVTLGRCD